MPYYRHILALEPIIPDLVRNPTILRCKKLSQAGFPGRNGGAEMNRIGIVLIVVAGLVAAGLIALSAWQIPAPTVVVNKVIPDEKLPR